MIARKSKVKRSTRLGRDLISAGREILAWQRGEIELAVYEVRVPNSIDVARLRRRLGFSQRGFASAFGFDVTAIHAWEQGRRRPDRAARILLKVIERNPDAVRQALAA